MSLRRFVNTLLAPTKYRLCTAGDLKTLATANRSPYEVIAKREPAGAVQTIFDVGANVGQTTSELRRRFPGAFIHAFEPTPTSREKYLRQHGSDIRVKLWPCAIASQPGRATFNINRRSMTNSLLTAAASSAEWVGEDNVTNVDRIEVEVRTLDEFCGANQITRIDILKLDIQGSELDALRGAAGLFQRKSIRYVCLEAPFVLLYDRQAFFHEIRGFLAAHGCELYGLFKLARHESDRLLFADALFFTAT
jgi:FkbM family methyltransferase